MMFHLRQLICLAAWWLAAQTGHCAEGAPEAPVKVVHQLYKDFAWVAVFAGGKDVDTYVGPGLMEQPRAVLERYFDPSMADLIVAETKCVNDNPGTLCNLEFDPLFGSSDPGAANLRIKGATNNSALVQFDYPSSGEKVRLEYALVQKDGHWKVRDITYVKARSRVSLRTILSRK
jgi:hypothetical protein